MEDDAAYGNSVVPANGVPGGQVLELTYEPQQSSGYDLAAFVRDVHAIRSQHSALPEIAERVRQRLDRLIRNPNWLAPRYQEPADDRYRQHVVYVAPDGGFSVVALVWRPGQATPIHDHVNWCVFGVYRGAEHETRFRLMRDEDGQEWLEEIGSAVNAQGRTSWLVPPSGDIHLVRNCADDTAISIHVYGADIARLGTSISRRYDLPVRRPAA